MTRHITLSGLTNGACRCANKRYEGTISAKFYVFSASAKSLIDLKFENPSKFSLFTIVGKRFMQNCISCCTPGA